MRWIAFLVLPLLCFASWSCNEAGKTVAGGPGDPSLFDQVPPNPSVPVVAGTFSVQISTIKTNPVGNPPERYDRFAAIRDTTTIIVAAGPTSNTINVRGAYLDPRIDDSLLLQDRGGNTWIGRSGIGTVPFSVTVTTDAGGNLLQYIVQMVSTGTDNATISTRRTYDRVPNAIILVPGLKYCRIRAAGPLPTPAAGDFFNMIVNSLGLAQLEPDTFEQKYRWNPLIGLNEAQVTTYDPIAHPAPNIEHYNTMDVLPPPVGSGTSYEYNHNSGDLEETIDYSPPPAGGWIAPLDCSGIWHGLPTNPSGVFQNSPYVLRNQQLGSDVTMTVDSGNLLAIVNAHCVWDSVNHIVKKNGVVDVFNIIRLEGNQMIAVRNIAKNTYDLLTLIRDETSSSPELTPHTPGVTGNPVNDTKSLTIQRFSNGTFLGGYSIGPDSTFPLEWWP
jgi:hypothetical protein